LNQSQASLPERNYFSRDGEVDGERDKIHQFFSDSDNAHPVASDSDSEVYGPQCRNLLLLIERRKLRVMQRQCLNWLSCALLFATMTGASSLSLIPLRRMWNTTSPFLQNELFRAVSTSASNAFLLSGHKTELELIEGLRFIESSSLKLEPQGMTTETFTASLPVRSKTEVKEEVNLEARKFEARKFSWNKEQVAVRSAGELEAHQPPEFRLLEFSVVGNSTVSASQALTFSYKYIEGPSAATLRMYVELGVCDDSSRERCRCSAVNLWLSSILINGSQTAGSVTSCMATTTVGEDWMAGFYRIENLYVFYRVENLYLPPQIIPSYDYPFLHSVVFEKQDGIAFKTYLPPTLLKIDYVGNISVVPGDILQFKISIAQRSFPVGSCSGLNFYFRSENTNHFLFWSTSRDREPESAVGDALSLECTKTVTVDDKVPRGNYSIEAVYLYHGSLRTVFYADGSVYYNGCVWHQPSTNISTTVFDSAPYFHIDVPEVLPAQLQDFKMLNDVLITSNSTITFNLTITEGSFALTYITFSFINERSEYLYFGGYVSDGNLEILAHPNSSNINFELSTPVFPHWTDGNYSVGNIYIGYGNYYSVSYNQDGYVYYGSYLGKNTHTLFRDEIFFELVQDGDWK
jgi:hypothetical protein